MLARARERERAIGAWVALQCVVCCLQRAGSWCSVPLTSSVSELFEEVAAPEIVVFDAQERIGVGRDQ